MNQPRDLVLVLPSELVRACFGLLDLKDRITASHVSRTWRKATLSERGLWNDYTVPKKLSRIGADAGLRALLERSDPVPFRLTCSADVPELVGPLVKKMHRVQVLRLSNIQPHAIMHMMQYNAPLLEIFSYSWYPEHTALIVFTWSDARAPRLRHVRLLKFMVAAEAVFLSMESFGGTLQTGHSLPRPLASIFPVLTDIQLHGITQNSLDALLPVPPTLKSATLISARSEPIDYAGFLSGCAPATLSQLRIDSAAATSIAPAVAQFARACGSGGTWELRLGEDSDMALHAAARAVSYTVLCHAHEPLASLIQADALVRLSTLSLFVAQYADVYRSVRMLPALALLVLGVRLREGTVLAADVFPSGGASIDAPALEAITIKIRGGDARDALTALPHVGSLVQSLACPRLAEIALLARDPGPLLDAAQSRLAGLAPRITAAVWTARSL